jgi:hypothetical protein
MSFKIYLSLLIFIEISEKDHKIAVNRSASHRGAGGF